MDALAVSTFHGLRVPCGSAAAEAEASTEVPAGLRRGGRGLHEWTRRRRRERPELGAGARAGGCPGPAPLYGGCLRALRGRAGGPNWEGRGRAAAGRRRVGLEPVTMPRRKQSHPQPVKCEGVKGQGSGAVGWGGAGVGSVARVQVWVEGDS